MASKLNRALQRRLLEQIADGYPDFVEPDDLGFDQADPAWVQNVAYLEEHGLVENRGHVALDGPPCILLSKITAQGIDFLSEDGGLNAVLNVVTVRLDGDTLKALLTQKVEESPLPPEEKSRIKELLQKAGEEGLKKATTLLVEAAVKHAPDIGRIVQAALS